MPINLIYLASVLAVIISDVDSLSQSSAGTEHSQQTSHGYSALPKVSEKISFTGSKHRYPGYTSGSCHLDTLSWAVKLKDSTFLSNIFSAYSLEEKVKNIAKETGMIVEGPIGHFSNIYLFSHPFSKHYTALCPDYQHSHDILTFQENKLLSFIKNSSDHIPVKRKSLFNFNLKNSASTKAKNITDNFHSVTNNLTAIIKHTEAMLDEHKYVDWYTRQTVRRRTKRSLYFNDPDFDLQWHLVNLAEPTMDINVTGVWERGVTGKNVVAVVVDDGLDWTVPDIHLNYNSKGSWDLNSNDANPLPDVSNKHNHHGTRCAGEIAAAANNNYCGVGVAYEAGIAGIRVLDGPMTDSLEATAFTKNFDVNDVYSCSWGPDDDGKTVDGPHHLANLALRHGVDFGRQGYGSIYVVASGNGGTAGDNCNYDGYANSIFTITIGAVDETGHMPYYAEECASMLAVTFSSGSSIMRSIVTTDWLHHDGAGCTTQHTGTSAAAPLAAGMITLMLSARPCLTWRDIQHIIVVTALKVDIDVAQWQKNAAGLHHSHKHGFGLMDAWRLVNAAKVWEPVPWMTVFTSELQTVNDPIIGGYALSYSYEVLTEHLIGYNLHSLEYVQVTVTIKHKQRGNLQIVLYCPSNTYSVLGAYRPKDDSPDGFDAWTFSTVRCWAERPHGLYRIKIFDKGTDGEEQGLFISWKLKLFGSALSFESMQERMQKVQESYSGQYLNDSYQASCPPPPDIVQVTSPLSEKVLKILILTGVFATFMAVYESLEYLFCYDNEKKEHSRLISLYKQAYSAANRTPLDESCTAPERQTLLQGTVSYDGSGETIPLQDVSSHLSRSTDHQSADELDNEAACSSQTQSLPGHDQPSSSGGHVRGNVASGNSSRHPNGKVKNQLDIANGGAVSGATNPGPSLPASHYSCNESCDADVDYTEFVCSDDFQHLK